MKKQQLYSIYDKTAKMFAMPFPANSKAGAVRQVALETQNKKESILVKYAQDFALYLVEEFDTETGKFANYKEPVFIMEMKKIEEK